MKMKNYGINFLHHILWFLQQFNAILFLKPHKYDLKDSRIHMGKILMMQANFFQGSFKNSSFLLLKRFRISSFCPSFHLHLW